MTPFEIYLLLKLDVIGATLGVAGIFTAAGAFITSLFDEKPLPKKTFVAGILLLGLATLLPSTNTAIAMYSVPQVFELEGVDQLPQKTVDALNILLDSLGASE